VWRSAFASTKNAAIMSRKGQQRHQIVQHVLAGYGAGGLPGQARVERRGAIQAEGAGGSSVLLPGDLDEIFFVTR
jgi:hypothetical protein